MIYEYVCDSCGLQTTALRHVANRHNAPDCQRCGAATRKMYSRAHLITRPYHERDEWREPLSRTDLLEEMRQADRQVEADIREAEREPDWSWLMTPEEAAAEMAV